MPFLQAAAVARVNDHFNTLASQNIHRDQAHAVKRAAAAKVLTGDGVPDWFAAEAVLRGVTAEDLAVDIAARPDNAAQRELRRQQLMLAIAAAKHPDEIPTP